MFSKNDIIFNLCYYVINVYFFSFQKRMQHHENLDFIIQSFNLSLALRDNYCIICCERSEYNFEIEIVTLIMFFS